MYMLDNFAQEEIPGGKECRLSCGRFVGAVFFLAVSPCHLEWNGLAEVIEEISDNSGE